jgi:hypothetical protein
LSDLIERLPAAALQGLVDHMGRSWLFFDIDPTHMTTLEHPDSADPARPPVRHPRAQAAAPGYPGRKRADAIRSRMTVLLSHAQMWAMTFAQPGNGQRTPAVERACDTIALIRDRLLGPRRACVVRADGEFGLVPSIAIVVKHALHYLIRCKDYRGIFAQPAVQAALRTGSARQMRSPDSPVTRELFDVPQVEWRNADGRVVLHARVVITRSPLPPGVTKPSVGHLHEGFVYEVFVTDLPAEAFSAAEIVSLYLGRGLLEKTLADEDRELPTDRWVTHHGPGEDLFQVLCQWVWNQHLALGAPLLDTPLPRVTRHDVPVTPCDPMPLSSVPDGRPAAATAEPAAPAGTEPVKPAAHAAATDPAEPTRAEATDPVPTEPAARAEATNAVPTEPVTSTDAPLPSAERFGPSAFVRDPQGEVQCPAGHRMHRVEIRTRRDGPRERYEAPRAACEACPLAPSCRRTPGPTSKGRIVDLPLASTGAASSVAPASTPPVAKVARRPPLPAGLPSPSTAGAPAARPRYLPVWQHPDLYWTDLPASTMRRKLHDTLDRQHVDISAPTPQPACPPGPRVIERDQRAHRRRTWNERLARNARPHNAPPITIHVSGVPPKLARAAGLTSSALQPRDMVEGSRRMDATT